MQIETWPLAVSQRRFFIKATTAYLDFLPPGQRLFGKRGEVFIDPRIDDGPKTWQNVIPDAIALIQIKVVRLVFDP